jgi:L-alanine-DL-glutamate epimerase-like enolase superfamily enzyme
VTSLGAKTISKNVALTIRLFSGAEGHGEASASLAMPQETQLAMSRWLNQIKRNFIGVPIDDLDFRTDPRLIRDARRGGHPTALGALECALAGALAQERGLSLRQLFGCSNKSIETDVTLSAWDTTTTLKIAAEYRRQGFRRFKIKVGKSAMEDDVARLTALHARFPHSLWWIDANQGFTESDLSVFFRAAEKNRWPVVALEQPTPKTNRAALKRARRLSPVPVYADESAGSWEAVSQLIDQNAADGLVLKIAKTGLAESYRILNLARANKIKTMFSCMAESAAGLTTSVAWAIGDGRFDWIDLDSFILTSGGRPTGFRSRGPWLS